MRRGYLVLHPVVDGRIDHDTSIYEHRLVYELTNNVKLSSTDFVHHINHDKSDNRPENLMVMSNSEHAKRHAIEMGKHIGPTYCVDCGKEIWNGSVRCVECGSAHRRTRNHPTKEQLTELIASYSNVEIARMCGVSDTSVRKWRKKYGLLTARQQREIRRALKKA